MAVGILGNADIFHPIGSHQVRCNGATRLKSRSSLGVFPACNNNFNVVGNLTNSYSGSSQMADGAQCIH